MCSSVVVKGIYVPRFDIDFVTQAARPLKDVLGLKDEECTDFIQKLEKDHTGIAEMCKRALDNEKARKEREASSKENTWKAYTIRLLTNGAFTTTITVTLALFVAYAAPSASKSIKPYVLVSASGGLLWGYLKTPSIIESKEPKSSELILKARMERSWMQTKLAQVNVLHKEIEEKIAKGEGDETMYKTRNLHLLVKSYFEEAVGR
jgi:hypothetical protein